MTTFQQD